MGAHAPSLHVHSRRSGAVRGRPPDRVLFQAGRDPRWEGCQTNLALDHHRSRPRAARFRRHSRLRLEHAPPPLRDFLYREKSERLLSRAHRAGSGAEKSQGFTAQCGACAGLYDYRREEGWIPIPAQLCVPRKQGSPCRARSVSRLRAGRPRRRRIRPCWPAKRLLRRRIPSTGVSSCVSGAYLGASFSTREIENTFPSRRITVTLSVGV